MPNWTNATTSRINALARLREVVPLERQRQQLTSTIVSLRTAVQIRDGRIERLELLVRERSETVDRLKYANERLGLENHLLMAMLVAPTPVEAEMLPAK
jgi:predicted HTH domain antitoxin